MTPVVVLLERTVPRQVDELMSGGRIRLVESASSFVAVRRASARAGGWHLPAALAARREPGTAGRSVDAGNGPGTRDPHLHLTPRQIEVLALLAQGRSDKMIARELDCAEATIKTHLTTIFKALNVRTRGQASAVAQRLERVP